MGGLRGKRIRLTIVQKISMPRRSSSSLYRIRMELLEGFLPLRIHAFSHLPVTHHRNSSTVPFLIWMLAEA